MNVIGWGRTKKENRSLTKFSSLFFSVLTVSLIFIGSCTKVNQFTIGENFLESETHLVVVDTFKVDVSTILLDSVRTSNKNIAFVGRYNDSKVGKMTCKSYFSLGYDSFENLETAAVYDSAAFIFVYSKFNAGDTTSTMKIGIHRVTEDMERFTDGYFYNNTEFEYQSEPLGTVRFYPTPKSTVDTTVSIPVNGLGEELFNLIANNDQIVSNADWFKDYFKGFVLTSESEDNNIILGFKATENSLSLKVYYHLDKEYPLPREITVKMGESTQQFNHVDFDFSSSPFKGIEPGGNEIPSTVTGNIAVMQGMIGLLPMVRFPSVQYFLLLNRQKVLKAELIFEPEKKSYNDFKLPEKLFLFESDKYENLLGQLKNSDGEAVFSELKTDYMYEEISYSIDITDYMVNELSDRYFDYYHGLLISLSREDMSASPARLLLETQNPAVKLRLFYITY